MNAKQQDKREARRRTRALLTKEITKEEYKDLLRGDLYILHDQLMRNYEDRYSGYIRHLNTLKQRQQMELDRDIDRILGLNRVNIERPYYWGGPKPW